MSHFGMLFSQRQSGSHNIFRPAETSTMTCRDLSFAGLLGNCALLKSSRHRVTNMTLGWEENLDVLMIPVTSYSAIKKLCIVRVSPELGRPQVARSWNRRSLWCSGTTVNKQARVKLELKLHSFLKDTDWVNTIIWSRQDHHSIKINQCLHLNRARANEPVIWERKFNPHDSHKSENHCMNSLHEKEYSRILSFILQNNSRLFYQTAVMNFKHRK